MRAVTAANGGAGHTAGDSTGQTTDFVGSFYVDRPGADDGAGDASRDIPDRIDGIRVGTDIGRTGRHQKSHD